MKIGIVFCAFISLAFGTVAKKWHTSADGSLYFIEHDQKYNWFEAWNECARKNMSLIAIDSYERHSQIDVVLRNMFTDLPSFWLAGHDNAVNNRYEWATTGEVFTFTNWGAGQPGRSPNEHCILLWKTWDWHDLLCSDKLGFICEANRCVKEKKKDDETGGSFRTLVWRNYNGNCC